MPVVTAGALCKAIGGKWIKGNTKLVISGINSKYSKVKPGYLYFDIKSQQAGNRNLLEAVNNGAVALVIPQSKIKNSNEIPNTTVIAVGDVWKAFWDTIAFYRNLYNIPVVGITGTSGKTTTTAMVSSIFSTRWVTLKTKRNLNLPQFVPKQIMRLNEGYQAAVFEIGMNRPGQISKQSRVIQPEVGIITNIGTGHIEYLGTHENIIVEKSGLMSGIPDHGCIILNVDDPATKRIDLSKFKGKVKYYGLNNKADYSAFDLEFIKGGTAFKMLLDGKKHVFFIPTYGKHNVYNALAAIAVARYYSFDIKAIKEGLAKYHKPKMRLQIVKGKKNCLLIDDTYNANTDSVIAGLEVLSALAGTKMTIAILGDMLEQGKFSIENHRKVGKKVEELQINWLVTVGEQAKEIINGIKSKKTKMWSFDNNQEAIDFLHDNLPEKAVVLVKGSRGVRMENVVKAIKLQ